MRATGCARVSIASVIALLDGEIPQSSGGGSDDASGAAESDGEDCSAGGSAGCSASSLVGEAVTVTDRKSTRLNSSHMPKSRMPSSA